MTITFGTAGNDVLMGSLDEDVVSGGDGNDAIFGSQGDDGRDSFQFIDAYPDTAARVWFSTTQLGSYRVVLGGLYGGAGDDVILGGGGDDWIEGQDGSDTLCGGSGADVFAYRYPILKYEGVDRITDFSREDGDKIDLGDIAWGVHFVRRKSGEDHQVWFAHRTVKYDHDGDDKPDLRIVLDGTFTMKASDFIFDA